MITKVGTSEQPNQPFSNQADVSSGHHASDTIREERLYCATGVARQYRQPTCLGFQEDDTERLRLQTEHAGSTGHREHITGVRESGDLLPRDASG